MKRYSIRSCTMAISTREGQLTVVPVPVNAIIAVRGEVRESDRLVEVVWDDKEYVMFAQDLRERGEVLD